MQLLGRWNGEGWSQVGDNLLYAQQLDDVLIHNGKITVCAPGGLADSSGNDGVVAAWDGTKWNCLGPSQLQAGDGICMAMYHGDLIVGGQNFWPVGASVARWNGSAWTPLGQSFNGLVRTLFVWGDDLIAGGDFTKSGSTATSLVARWDGISWQAMGAGFKSQYGQKSVRRFAEHRGSLYATGDFHDSGSTIVVDIARWDGTAWQPVGDGLGPKLAVGRAIMSFGSELVVVGDSMCTSPQGNNFIARWTDDGIPWIASQPQTVRTNDGGGAAFPIQVADGYDQLSALTYQWRRNGVPIADGAGGASAGGGVVAGADSPLISIAGVTASDLGDYDCVVSCACGQVASWPASLEFPCAADFDGSGFADKDDFDAFVLAYEAGDLSTDFDGSGFVDTDDFTAFVGAFEAGC